MQQSQILTRILYSLFQSETCKLLCKYPSVASVLRSLASALCFPVIPAAAAALDLKLTNDKHPVLKGTHVYVNPTMSQTQTHTDSVDGQDHDDAQKKIKSRRPASKLTFTSHRHHEYSEALKHI